MKILNSELAVKADVALAVAYIKKMAGITVDPNTANSQNDVITFPLNRKQADTAIDRLTKSLREQPGIVSKHGGMSYTWNLNNNRSIVVDTGVATKIILRNTKVR